MDAKLKRENKLIIFLCWAAYTAAYIGRLNLNAYIEPIRDQLGASKSELGLVSFLFLIRRRTACTRHTFKKIQYSLFGCGGACRLCACKPCNDAMPRRFGNEIHMAFKRCFSVDTVELGY